ncbi:FkbM family methyltransferase [Roseofilum sp. BLCC_M91]|uniref:FkbM family methyltransferase n=1 Tax=Roseofilum halophilum BLCC-M91 TaxID=3022259 RepID=A0ABT7BKF7_9CYAN|nr:FkbM family methyltransferase [Roseofilum halophilum]MDJ1179664.1 FkbM family methyltransferase [Roseofilum halophilum BLCC-M91]
MVNINQEFQQAYQYQREGSWDAARQGYERVLELDPQHISTLVNLGVLYKKQGEYGQAARLYEQVLQHKPNHVIAHYNLALVYELQGRLSEAVRHYSHGLLFQPTDENLGKHLQQALVAVGSFKSDRPLYEQALHQVSLSLPSLMELINFLRREEYLEVAIALLQVAIEQYPERSALYSLSGGIYNQMGNYAEAMKCFEQALERSPEEPNYLQSLGITFAKQEQWEAAQPYLQQAVTLAPNLRKAQRWLNFVNVVCGDRPQVEFNSHNQAIQFQITGKNLDVELTQVNDRQFYEQPELDFINETLRRRSVIVDVGANSGNHLVYFAKILGAETVIPIEFQPDIIAALKTNIALNQITNVDLSKLGYAVGKTPGRAQLQNHPTGDLCLTELKEDPNGAVEVLPLDRLIASNIDFIKMDVQGLEIEVLEGAEGLLQQFQPDGLIEVTKRNQPLFLSFLERINYQIIKEFREWNYSNFYIQSRVQ